MKILVTGGAGFIGSYLSRELSRKHEVIVFDNLFTGKKENLPEEMEFIKGDLRKICDLAKIPEVDVVFHLASQTSASFSIKSPKLDVEINILGTINLLNWCNEYGIKKVIYTSSAAVYGEPQYLPIDEEHPTNPISPYGISKLSAEKYVLLYRNSIVLRLANVYGKGGAKEGEAGVIQIFAEKAKNREQLEIFGDGTQTRDFINVKDAANACMLALSYEGKERIFNIGSGKETSVNELVELFKKYEPNLKVKYLRRRNGDISRSYFDISRARKELNFIPRVKLEDGIKELLEIF